MVNCVFMWLHEGGGEGGWVVVNCVFMLHVNLKGHILEADSNHVHARAA